MIEELIQLELDLNIDGIKLPSATINKNNHKHISMLKRKVFIYDSSKADEIYFKHEILNFLLEESDRTFTKALYHAIWQRNENGKNGKYTYFNEHSQRVYIDKYFYEWAKLMLKIINEQYLTYLMF